jgi:hypothetical protein
MTWLENKNGYNRKVSQRHVDNIARDIRAGNWQVTHMGIAFDPSGQLIDGQHRLWAIFMADTPVDIYVWFNVSQESLQAVDRGRIRSISDVMNIAGVDSNVTDYKVAALKAMVAGIDCEMNQTASELSGLMQRHSKALSFAMDNLPAVFSARGVNTAITRGIVARATYCVPEIHLEEFCHKLTSGILTNQKESVIVNIRKFLADNRSNTWEKRWEKYAKFQKVLYSWLNGKNPSRLMPADYEIFPLPEEVEADATVDCTSGS